MSDNIAEVLRDHAKIDSLHNVSLCGALHDAARAIDRLTDAMKRIVAIKDSFVCACCEDCSCGMYEAIRIAEEALSKDE